MKRKGSFHFLNSVFRQNSWISRLIFPIKQFRTIALLPLRTALLAIISPQRQTKKTLQQRAGFIPLTPSWPLWQERLPPSLQRFRPLEFLSTRMEINSGYLEEIKQTSDSYCSDYNGSHGLLCQMCRSPRLIPACSGITPCA